MTDRTGPMRVLVVTIVHNPDDARIRYRQIASLLSRGVEVTYAAPFRAFDVTTTAHSGLRVIDLPRARGKRRLQAIRKARKIIKHQARRHDVVLIHDPDLLLALLASGVKNVVWDVHEDAAAAIEAKQWVPALLRRPARKLIRLFERWAEKRFPLLLAEYEYQDRFRRNHSVVPNTVVPADKPAFPSNKRVVYLGSITHERGANTLCELGQLIAHDTDSALELHVIGPAWDTQSELLMKQAHGAGNLVWHGFQPQTVALHQLDGALAGLSLLQDLPNYRHSMPTKVLEYMGYGVPVITTPLPLPAKLVGDSACGFTVPFDDADAVFERLKQLDTDADMAIEMGNNGWNTVKESYDWKVGADVFFRSLKAAASNF